MDWGLVFSMALGIVIGIFAAELFMGVLRAIKEEYQNIKKTNED